MAAEEDGHKKLQEVRTVLQGLQRIGDHLPPAVTASKNPGSVATALSRTGVRSGAAESPAGGRQPVQGKRLGALALAMLAGGTVIVLAGDLFVKYWPSSPPSGPAATGDGGDPAVVTAERTGGKTSAPPVDSGRPAPQAGTVDVRAPTPAVPPATANPSVDNAHLLMDGGHIVAAREMLSRPDLSASQEGAWLLARSYDPSYLMTIRSPDAPADQRQAEEWYRRWRDIAGRNGMVMDDQRFQRIINSMHHLGDEGNSLPERLALPPGRNQ
jgi:hypothetical protein